MKIIVNADDMGYTRGVTEGIIEGYEKGIVTSTTVMCNMPNAAQAAQRLRSVPGLGTGVHLTLTCGRPLTRAKTLTDQHGDFLKNTQFYKVYVDPAEVEAEFRAQIEKFMELFGRQPTHLDCHQGCYDGQTLTMARVGGIGEEHNTEEILAVTLDLAKEYHLPLRRHCEYLLLSSYHGEQATPEHFIKMLDEHADAEKLEFMVHPGWCDLELYQKSSYSLERVQELAGLCDHRLKEALQVRNIELVHF